jgi:endonuclease YncB( thermonuclease family)
VRRPHFLVALAIVALVAALGGALDEWRSRPTSPPPQTGTAISGRASVVDGDSLQISGHRIRLFGIDAPEARQDCRDSQSRVYACGVEARMALSAIIGGQPATCTPVGESHDRDVAICIVDGRDLSEALVRSGHALELRQHSRGRYSAAENEARAARRGLWAGDFERPSQWRREHPR